MDGNDLVCLEKRGQPNEDNPSLDEVLIPKVISHVNLKYNVVKEHYEMDCDEVKVIREEFFSTNREIKKTKFSACIRTKFRVGSAEPCGLL